MRILIVTGIFPPDIGGPATYVPHMAAALTRLGHRVIVVTLSDRLDHADETYGFRVVRLPRRVFKPWRWMRTIFVLVRTGRRMDLLLVNGLAMEAALAATILGRPTVLKVVGDLAWERATASGWVKDDFETFQGKRYGLKIRYLKGLRAWWTRRAQRVIVPSQYLATWVRSWGVSMERIVVIYNAVEKPSDIHPAHVMLGTPLRLVTVGRLVPWKQLEGLLRAVGRLENVGLVMVGDGPERDRLKALAWRLGISHRVHFAGQKSRGETLALMAACHVFVLNSTYEGLPHVVLEAMSLGLPVVATAVGGTPEVVGDGENGFLVAPLDEDGLSKALLRVISDARERSRLGEGARRAASRFGAERMIEETEALLKAVAYGRST
jgi:glycosyltransferase involved in cell wall biosynthesis